MAQEGEGHGGDGEGTLQHTSVTAQPSLTNYQLTRLHRSEGAGMVCVAVITIWTADWDDAKFRCEQTLLNSL